MSLPLTTPNFGQAAALDEALAAAKLGRAAGVLTLAGVLLSGPVGIALVNAIAPQPDWRDAELFARNYSPVQLLPYALGFLLIAGCVGLVVAPAWALPPAQRGRGGLALVLTAVFASFILLNYVTQTTVVPALVARRSAELDPLIALLAMRNPRSIAWALEMWGYAFFGVAFWLAAPAFARPGLERVLRALIALNALLSVAGALLTAADAAWVFSRAGLLSFGAWNGLMVVLAACAALAWQRRIEAGR